MSAVLSRSSSHEQVMFWQDPPSGLKAIIAIYSTALGPALGGTRCYPYGSEEDALADVLELSRAMAYKSALAGLDLGGGKAIIIGDPAVVKSDALLESFGRAVSSLGGRYITACDVGTESADMDVVARTCPHVTGRSTTAGGAGDSATLTAYGLMRAMTAAATELWGDVSLAGLRVGISGTGKVGSKLAAHLVALGATVLVHDADDRATARLLARHPEVTAVRDGAELISGPLDIYAPCALGGALTPAVARALDARLICGGANNQLSEPAVERLLADRGIAYAPDFLVNAGGLIQVADELSGYNPERAMTRAAAIYQTTTLVFRRAAARGMLPGEAARELAEQRLAGRGEVSIPCPG
jgi:valine dehydrogenase (NAD+)